MIRTEGKENRELGQRIGTNFEKSLRVLWHVGKKEWETLGKLLKFKKNLLKFYVKFGVGVGQLEEKSKKQEKVMASTKLITNRYYSLLDSSVRYLLSILSVRVKDSFTIFHLGALYDNALSLVLWRTPYEDPWHNVIFLKKCQLLPDRPRTKTESFFFLFRK